MSFSSLNISFKNGYSSLGDTFSGYWNQGGMEPLYVKIIGSLLGLGIVGGIFNRFHQYQEDSKNFDSKLEDSQETPKTRKEHGRLTNADQEVHEFQYKLIFNTRDESFELYPKPYMMNILINAMDDYRSNKSSKRDSNDSELTDRDYTGTDNNDEIPFKLIPNPDNKNEGEFKYDYQEDNSELLLNDIALIKAGFEARISIDNSKVCKDDLKFFMLRFEEIKEELSKDLNTEQVQNNITDTTLQNEGNDKNKLYSGNPEVVNDTEEKERNTEETGSNADETESVRITIRFHHSNKDEKDQQDELVEELSKDNVDLMRDLMLGYKEIMEGKDNDSLTLLIHYQDGKYRSNQSDQDKNKQLEECSNILRIGSKTLFELNESDNDLSLDYLGGRDMDNLARAKVHLGRMNEMILILQDENEDRDLLKFLIKANDRIRNLIENNMINDDQVTENDDTTSNVDVSAEIQSDHSKDGDKDSYDIKVKFRKLRDDTMKIIEIIINRYGQLLLNHDPYPLNCYWDSDGNFQESIDEDNRNQILYKMINERDLILRKRDNEIGRLKFKETLLSFDRSNKCLIFKYPKNESTPVITHIVGFKEMFRLLNDESRNDQDQISIVYGIGYLNGIINHREQYEAQELNDSSSVSDVQETDASLPFVFEAGPIRPGFKIEKIPMKGSRKMKKASHAPQTSIILEELDNISMDLTDMNVDD